MIADIARDVALAAQTVSRAVCAYPLHVLDELAGVRALTRLQLVCQRSPAMWGKPVSLEAKLPLNTRGSLFTKTPSS